MALAIQILTILILAVVLVTVCTVAFVVLRYTLTIIVYLVKLDEWRSAIRPGMDVYVIDSGSAKRRTIVALNETIIQVRSKEGNLSGHHISAIYPITTDYGTTK